MSEVIQPICLCRRGWRRNFSFVLPDPSRFLCQSEWDSQLSGLQRFPTKITHLSGLVAMLYLHRSFFAQTMLDHPDNPLSSPFAPSFLAACRSASIIIKAAENLFRRSAPVASRVWFLMYHMLSAAVRRNHPFLSSGYIHLLQKVILGTVVTRSPTSISAPIAMRDFEIAFGIFTEAAGHNQRAKIALVLPFFLGRSVR